MRAIREPRLGQEGLHLGTRAARGALHEVREGGGGAPIVVAGPLARSGRDRRELRARAVVGERSHEAGAPGREVAAPGRERPEVVPRDALRRAARGVFTRDLLDLAGAPIGERSAGGEGARDGFGAPRLDRCDGERTGAREARRRAARRRDRDPRGERLHSERRRGRGVGEDQRRGGRRRPVDAAVGFERRKAHPSGDGIEAASAPAGTRHQLVRERRAGRIDRRQGRERARDALGVALRTRQVLGEAAVDIVEEGAHGAARDDPRIHLTARERSQCAFEGGRVARGEPALGEPRRGRGPPHGRERARGGFAARGITADLRHERHPDGEALGGARFGASAAQTDPHKRRPVAPRQGRAQERERLFAAHVGGDRAVLGRSEAAIVVGGKAVHTEREPLARDLGAHDLGPRRRHAPLRSRRLGGAAPHTRLHLGIHRERHGQTAEAIEPLQHIGEAAAVERQRHGARGEVIGVLALATGQVERQVAVAQGRLEQRGRPTRGLAAERCAPGRSDLGIDIAREERGEAEEVVLRSEHPHERFAHGEHGAVSCARDRSRAPHRERLGERRRDLGQVARREVRREPALRARAARRVFRSERTQRARDREVERDLCCPTIHAGNASEPVHSAACGHGEEGERNERREGVGHGPVECKRPGCPAIARARDRPRFRTSAPAWTGANAGIARARAKLDGAAAAHRCPNAGPQRGAELEGPAHFAQNPWMAIENPSEGLHALRFDNTFVRELPADPETALRRRTVEGACYSRVATRSPRAPRLVACSREVAALLGLDEATCRSEHFTRVFSGAELLPGMDPYAMCYGGHQFGHWARQLGDGRATNLGQVIGVDGARWTLQLKGAGPTPYSRSADGLAVLRSSVREFLCSEAMHHLGVPTTRALSLMTTGDRVVRDMFYDGNAEEEPGAIVCRVARSFTRFGNFELPASRGDVALLRRLAEYTLRFEFPELDVPPTGELAPEHIVRLYAEVAARTARMVAHWMRVGFVHGVMNTDNMSILGETIDYGPYGWLEGFEPGWTPNTTDAEGRRYAFGNQPAIAHWNLCRLGGALVPLVGDVAPIQAIADGFPAEFAAEHAAMLAQKLGLTRFDGERDAALVRELERVMQLAETDMTLFWRGLIEVDVHSEPADDAAAFAHLQRAFYVEQEVTEGVRSAWRAWLAAYRARARQDGSTAAERAARMRGANPLFVLRNYLAQVAIDAATQGDPTRVEELLDTLRRPYTEQPGREHLAAPRPEWARHRAGCSMLSCSS